MLTFNVRFEKWDFKFSININFPQNYVSLQSLIFDISCSPKEHTNKYLSSFLLITHTPLSLFAIASPSVISPSSTKQTCCHQFDKLEKGFHTNSCSMYLGTFYWAINVNNCQSSKGPSVFCVIERRSCGYKVRYFRHKLIHTRWMSRFPEREVTK